MAQRAYVSFDWAAKKLLRQKSNFVILEGFIWALLGEKMTIVKMLDSEGNQEDERDKFNRVDMLAENSRGEHVLIEVQNNRELDYFHRMLYGTSKLITDHMQLGMEYGKIQKIYSIHIVYFDLGQGEDYAYHGATNFFGLNKSDELKLSVKQQNNFKCEYPKELFPEYYILRVNDFNTNAVTPLEEWMAFLKNDFISEETTTPGLPEAKKQLDYHHLTAEERRKFDRFFDNLRYQHSVLTTEKEIGRDEGRVEGRAEGIEIGRAEGEAKGEAKTKRLMILALKKKGMTAADIAEITNLCIDEVNNIV